ncbi:MAG: hypothetical protein H6937_04485 [Burkholderiales bacterium]|nr:hypothetical protein [Burkholderiales bacterium]MDR4517772.1 hypothetical protein [Nitrosomonas sp.]
MIINREIFGIMSTLFSFATGMSTENIRQSGVEQNSKAVTFSVSGKSFCGYEQ